MPPTVTARTPDAQPDFWTPREVAAQLGTSVRTVYNLLAAGELTPTKVRSMLRVRREDLDAYIRQLPARADEVCEISDAAEMLRVSPRTICELIADGELTAIRIPRHRSRVIRRQVLDDYLARARANA